MKVKKGKMSLTIFSILFLFGAVYYIKVRIGDIDKLFVKNSKDVVNSFNIRSDKFYLSKEKLSDEKEYYLQIGKYLNEKERKKLIKIVDGYNLEEKEVVINNNLYYELNIINIGDLEEVKDVLVKLMKEKKLKKEPLIRVR